GPDVSLLLDRADRAVRAEDQDRLRLARRDVVERALDARDRRALALDDPDELIALEKAGRRDGRRKTEEDEHRADRGAEQQATAGPRRLLVVVQGAHRESVRVPASSREALTPRVSGTARPPASGGWSACASGCWRPSRRPAACARRRSAGGGRRRTARRCGPHV